MKHGLFYDNNYLKHRGGQISSHTTKFKVLTIKTKCILFLVFRLLVKMLQNKGVLREVNEAQARARNRKRPFLLCYDWLIIKTLSQGGSDEILFMNDEYLHAVISDHGVTVCSANLEYKISTSGFLTALHISQTQETEKSDFRMSITLS